MSNSPKETLRQTISQTLAAFQSPAADFAGADNPDERSLHYVAAAKRFFQTLGYSSDKTLELSGKEDFLRTFDAENKIRKDPTRKANARFDDWKSIHLLFQFDSDDVVKQNSLFEQAGLNQANIQSYLFFALDLSKDAYSRTELSGITRAINSLFAMPVLLLFRHGSTLTLSVIDRRPHKRADYKDVLEKVTLIKDIRFQNPHRAHIEILHDLAFENLNVKKDITTFDDLHAAWRRTLNLAELNKKFYRELANWYFWAVSKVAIPNATEQTKNEFVIRLITRLVFTWFLKEKNLVPETLFDEKAIADVLNRTDQTGSTYYKAILQNLFFATLNQPMEKRRFVTEKDYQGKSDGYLITTLYRYQRFFKNEQAAVQLFKNIPFLNGGLFECLDREATSGQKNTVVREDWFSNNPANEKKLTVPDEIFFGSERDIDLSDIYDDKKRSHEKVKGLFHILNAYKFTIAENTPIEEEIALDPELLGRIFENLLAAYNPETGTSARKATGSFYTPREIVDYMVSESLMAYFASRLSADETRNTDARLRQLFSYSAEPHGFSAAETDTLINAIDTLKILDPACGSGAFPMGVLHKLTHLLGKLDPDNRKWKERQRENEIGKEIERIQADKEIAGKISVEAIRQKAIADLETELKRIEDEFELNHPDYARKLYLIRECIYGVDIQPVAIQIAKLRFFISLVIDQTPNDAKPNRNIESLPNLETKFVCANSLIGIARPDGLLIDPNVEKKEAELEAVREKFFAAKSRKEKKKLEEQDKTLREALAKLLKHSGFQKESAEQLAKWNPYDVMQTAPFFDAEWMFGVRDGFDVVIGNPPYVRQEQFKDLKPSLQPFKVYSGTADLLVYFYEMGCNTLRTGGTLTLITSNKFMRAGYGSNLRAFLKTKMSLKTLIDFGDLPVFDATAYPCIFIAQKNPPAAKHAFLGTTVRTIDELNALEETLAANAQPISQASLDDKAWRIESGEAASLLRKLNANSTPLGKFVNDKFYRGITTGFNEAFVIDAETKAALIKADKKSAEVIKPFLRGRDIKRYAIHSPNLFLIYVPWEFDTKKYPAVFEHLKKFKKELSERPEAKEGRFPWYAMSRYASDYYQEFEKPKIMYQVFQVKPCFVFDEQGYFSNNSVWIIPTEDKTLLAVLNSPVGWFLISQFCTKLQNGFQLIADYFGRIPIPKASEREATAIGAKVSAVLAAKAAGKETGELEKEIDAMVYGLYGLTAEEIKIVEGR
jgi:adenine-specific DNA-methyltransferase